jgi:hypothetical protein
MFMHMQVMLFNVMEISVFCMLCVIMLDFVHGYLVAMNPCGSMLVIFTAF